MENNLFGIIIKVKNIDMCRSFYRDILELGAPVMDSNFWVEFKLNESVSLLLEKFNELEVTDAKSKVSWILRTENPEFIMERLKQYGYNSDSEQEYRAGFKLFRFSDPEGNPFYIANSNTI